MKLSKSLRFQRVSVLSFGFFLFLQEASQQRVAAFKAAAHLSQPVSTHKGRKMVNVNADASSRAVDIGLHTTSAATGHARSVSHDALLHFWIECA